MDRKKSGDANRKWGKEAELIAADYLRVNGYVVREQNWRSGNHIEIDIIAEKEGTIVFVEVKARKGDYQMADEAVDSAKRQKMIRGGDIYLRGMDKIHPFRLDIITITGTPDNYQLNHIEDAFLPDLQ